MTVGVRESDGALSGPNPFPEVAGLQCDIQPKHTLPGGPFKPADEALLQDATGNGRLPICLVAGGERG